MPLIPVADAPVLIGRFVGVTIRLPDPTISRRHATVRRAAGEFSVEDHDSRFGTFVNGARVRVATLRPGDQVRFGAVITHRVEPDGLRLDVQAGGMTLEARGLTVSVPRGIGGQPLLAEVSLQIPPDSFTGILGPSGAGKSTLLNCLVGAVVPDRGRLAGDGDFDPAEDLPAYRAMLGYVSQDDVVFPALTVRENLADAARLRLGRGVGAAGIAAAIDQVLNRVDLVEQAGKLTAVLSGGQRKRLSVATELLRRPRLLLLDEPTAGLDPASEAHLMEQRPSSR